MPWMGRPTALPTRCRPQKWRYFYVLVFFLPVNGSINSFDPLSDLSLTLFDVFLVYAFYCRGWPAATLFFQKVFSWYILFTLLVLAGVVISLKHNRFFRPGRRSKPIASFPCQSPGQSERKIENYLSAGFYSLKKRFPIKDRETLFCFVMSLFRKKIGLENWLNHWDCAIDKEAEFWLLYFCKEE